MIRSRILIALVAFVAAFAVVAPRSAHGQERGAAALDQLVRGLTTTGRVLVIGAHPDDEDTQLLAWLARGHQVQVAYLSMTRGDGGQNLIGDELGEALGAIRTEELLAARRLDGAQQFFSRAYDFGFSKNAEETFLHWDRAQLTADVVRVIRAYRPHVVIAVWSGTRNDGHGHHEAAGLLARDGFELAGDTVRFPVAVHGRPWVPSKLYRGAWARALQPTLTFNVGEYDAVMGRSPAELAAASRSQHRSQGQGGLERRGAIPSRLTRELTRVNEATPATAERSIFDGMDTSIAHVAALDSAAGAFVRRAAAQADWVQRTLDLRRPHLVVDTLAQMVVQLEAARNAARRCGVMPPRSMRANQPAVECSPDQLDLDVTLDRLLARAQRALLEAAGVAIEVTAEKELLAFADSMQATVTVHNRGRAPIAFRSLRMTGSPPFEPTYVEIAPDSSYTLRRRVLGFVDHRPWWLGGRDGAMFADTRSPADGAALVSYGADAALIPSVALAEDVRRISDVRVTVGIGSGVTTTVAAGEVMYRVADPVMGEQWRPAGGVPPVTLELDRGFEWMRADQPLDRRIRLTMRSYTVRERRLALKYLLPAGLRVEGVPDSIVLAPGEVREISVRLRGQLKPGRHEFGIGAESEGTTYTEGFRAVEYPHIRPIRLYRSSALYLQAVAVNVPRTMVVAYVAGVSDAVAPALQGLDIPLVMLTPEELALMDLARFSTVVIGPRAYETHPELATQNPRLLDWVRNGGTLVVQYGQFEMARPGMMPYPIAFTRPAARVTLEGAPVRTLEPASKLLTWPNRITESDWADWVQERGLYMPTTIDPRYRTPLAMNDPGEPENRGAILETTLGKGRYVYTSLSLFRQVPAGVPGSMRLLVNLLSAGIISTQP